MLWLCAMLVGCSGGDGGGGAITCSAQDRTGTYLMHFVERANGTCGAVPDALGVLDASDAPASGCTITEEVWSADKCDLTRTIVCDDVGNQTTSYGTGFTTQTTDDGSRLSGTLTMDVRDLYTGETICVSAYDVTAVRQ